MCDANAKEASDKKEVTENQTHVEGVCQVFLLFFTLSPMWVKMIPSVIPWAKVTSRANDCPRDERHTLEQLDDREELGIYPPVKMPWN